VLTLCAATAVIAFPTTDLIGYTTSGYKWPTSQVSYYVNPASKHVSPSAAIAAVQAAAAVWSQQSRANIALVYAGQTNGSTAQLNYKNEVFFRGEAGGGYTYWWASGGSLVDADIIMYEGSIKYFTGSDTCTGYGQYVEDLATHEFGHVLGLRHSSDSIATMYSTTGYCDPNWRTLAADDIAGIESLYPPSSKSTVPNAPSGLAVNVNAASPTSSLSLSWQDNSNDESGFRVERSTDGVSFAQIAQLGAGTRSYTNTGLAAGTMYYYRVHAYNSAGASAHSNVAWNQTHVAANTAPSVSITSPKDGASLTAGSLVSFSGAASDPEDGNLSSGLKWVSSLDGAIGTGASFSRALTAGTHIITASVSDSAGAQGASSVSVNVTSTVAASGGATLTATGAKVKGSSTVTLSWSGLTSTSVDVLRNGAKVTTTANDGFHIDSPKGGGTLTYQVCAAGTSTCTNTVSLKL
jgi:hypothetical protein